MNENHPNDLPNEARSGFLELIRSTGRMEGKLDQALQNMVRLESLVARNDARLGVLERWQAKVVAMAALAGAGISTAVHYFLGKGA